MFGPPKSAAGQRTVIIPAAIIPDLAWHLARFAAPGGEVGFTSSTGSPLHHSNFYRRVWMPALRKTGLSGVHFHDLRHCGNLLAAAAGATLRELMARMGHSSTRAALIYHRRVAAVVAQPAPQIPDLRRERDHVRLQLLDRGGLPGDHRVPGSARRAARGRGWQIRHKPP
jgi:integrase